MEFEYYPSEKTGLYPSEVEGEAVLCSKECQNEWVSEAFTGDGHPNWAGGVWHRRDQPSQASHRRAVRSGLRRRETYSKTSQPNCPGEWNCLSSVPMGFQLAS